MENKDCKPWDRPWSTEDISENSGNWNLAGDAGLLRHLQQFSQALLERTHASEVALNSLVDGMKSTAVDISNVTNTFLMLTNTQFVENRVYDDDDEEKGRSSSEAHPQVKSKEEQAAENLATVKNSVMLGLSVLDTMFDTVEVPSSDSEDEENSESIGRVILQPRNTYLLQPLPCMIGTKEFLDDDTVGLAELLSDEDNVEHNALPLSSSGTNSDEEHEVTEADESRHIHSYVSTESENSEPESERSIFLGKKNFIEPSCKFMEIPEVSDNEGAIFGGESPPEVESVSGLPKATAPVDFASELAAKLGDIRGEKTSIAGNAQKQSQGNSGTTTAQETLSKTTSVPSQPDLAVPEKIKKVVGGVSVLGMVKNSSVKISHPLPPSAKNNASEDVKPQTVVPSITGFSADVPAGISNLAGMKEPKTSFINTQEYGSRSLFDPDEEDALFLPSSTPKKQSALFETSQKKMAASDHHSDTSEKSGFVKSKPADLSRPSKSTLTAKSSSSHVLEGSDSDDDKNLFSSNCSSVSSRSYKSQWSDDFLGKTVKIAQKEDLFQNSSVFGSDDLDDPTFDIFSTKEKKNVTLIPKTNKDDKKKGKKTDSTIIEGIESIGKTSSDIFDSLSDVPDIFSSKSNVENAQPKEGLFSSKDLTFQQTNDFDDIFSAIDTSKTENVNLFTSQKLDDDFDIFSTLVTVNTKDSSKNSKQDISESKYHLPSNQSTVVSDTGTLRERGYQEELAHTSDFMDGTNIFSSTSKPTPYINVPSEKEDEVGVGIPISSSKDVLSSSGVISNITDGLSIPKNEKVISEGQNKTLVKPKPPGSLSITKTSDLIFKGSSENVLQGEIENTDFRSKGNVKSISKSIVLPSDTTNVQFASSLPGSAGRTTSDSYSFAGKSLITDNKKLSEERSPEVEKPGNNQSAGKSSIETSPLFPSTSSLITPNSQAVIFGSQWSPRVISREKAVSFESPASASSVLQNVAKGRARIPAKRRPQSRKARKEAVKASSVDSFDVDIINAQDIHSKEHLEGTDDADFSGKLLSEEVEENHVDPHPELKSESSVLEAVSSGRNGDSHTTAGNMFSAHYSDTKPFSPSTDEEDFFGVPSYLPFEYNNKDASGYKNEVLFGDAPVLSPVGVSNHEESDQKCLHEDDDLPPLFKGPHGAKVHLAEDLISNASSELQKDEDSSNIFSKTHDSSVKLLHHIDEPNYKSLSSPRSEGDLFEDVDSTALSKNESEFFPIVPKCENENKNPENMSENKTHLGFVNNNGTSASERKKVGSSKTNGNEDKAHIPQQKLAKSIHSDISSEIRKTVSNDQLFQNDESEVDDLFSSGTKNVFSSQLFDEQLFSPQTKQRDQMFSVSESSSSLPSDQSKEQFDGSSKSYNNISENEVLISSGTEKTKQVTVQKTKSKKKDTIFLDHDEENEDISIFSSSSRVAVSESASPSRNTGSKSYSRMGENTARHKSRSLISKTEVEKFEDPLKVTK
ncbi:WASH complex subunit 2-like isoform X2 [Bacillus rossius redtenbacheri]|uniref:WASH complex subunit 2-like isoform X2 n=2 Tax=Bacillus rossius redtenbacheri TaxID=93214 RepID=UPI002FDDDFF1